MLRNPVKSAKILTYGYLEISKLRNKRFYVASTNPFTTRRIDKAFCNGTLVGLVKSAEHKRVIGPYHKAVRVIT